MQTPPVSYTRVGRTHRANRPPRHSAPTVNAALAAANRPGNAAGQARAGAQRLTTREQADRILATILNSNGPVILVVPGTNGSPYEHANLTTVREMLRRIKGSAVVATIPYDNSPLKATQRFFRINLKNGSSTLGMVLDGIRAQTPNRHVYLVGESQGSWVIADELRNPRRARQVTRAVLFSTPGFVRTPAAVGAALTGSTYVAGRLPAANNDSGVLEISHSDDIVPGLFRHLNGARIGSFVQSLAGLVATGVFDYSPHYYDPDGIGAAKFLLTGVRPAHAQHKGEGITFAR